MSTSTKLALVFALVAAGFFVPACHRLDDPPAPLAPQGLSAINLERTKAAPPEIFVEGDPIIVRADADGDIVTAADVIRQHARWADAAVVEKRGYDLRHGSANRPAASSNLWW